MNKALILTLMMMIAALGCDREKYQQGKVIYDTLCLNCHMSDGTGLGDLYPNLSKSEYLTIRKSELPCIIKHGIRSDKLSTVYMPAHPKIEEASMTNLINYITYKWGDQHPVKIKDVMTQLDICVR